MTHIANNADIINGLFAVKEGQELGIFYAPYSFAQHRPARPDGTRYIDDADKGNYELVNGMVTNKTTKQVVITDANDQSVLGSALPKFNASFINTFTINKNLTASVPTGLVLWKQDLQYDAPVVVSRQAFERL